jgi:hypothetical protein
MKRDSDTSIALVALIAFAAWLFVGLPLLYLPSEHDLHGEILGVKYGEWLLFLATAWLAWVTWLLVKGADKTAERQLRAYMGVTAASEIDIDATADYIDVRLIFHNYGATPAYRVHYRGELQIVNSSVASGFFQIDIDRIFEYAPRVIQPHAEFGYVARLTIDPAERARVKIGTEQRIYLWGVLIYWDAFEAKRHTKFRFYFGGDECVRARRMFWAGEKDANQAN